MINKTLKTILIIIVFIFGFLLVLSSTTNMTYNVGVSGKEYYVPVYQRVIDFRNRQAWFIGKGTLYIDEEGKLEPTEINERYIYVLEDSNAIDNYRLVVIREITFYGANGEYPYYIRVRDLHYELEYVDTRVV